MEPVYNLDIETYGSYRLSVTVVTNLVDPEKIKDSYIGRVDCSKKNKNLVLSEITELLIKSGKTKNLSTFAVEYISSYIYFRYISSSKTIVDTLEIYDVVIKAALSHMRDEIVEYMMES